jgi:hypothetical protein
MKKPATADKCPLVQEGDIQAKSFGPELCDECMMFGCEFISDERRDGFKAEMMDMMFPSGQDDGFDLSNFGENEKQ